MKSLKAKSILILVQQQIYIEEAVWPKFGRGTLLPLGHDETAAKKFAFT